MLSCHSDLVAWVLRQYQCGRKTRNSCPMSLSRSSTVGAGVLPNNDNFLLRHLDYTQSRWTSGSLKPVNSLQAHPELDANEEGWYLRLAFQRASEGETLPVAAKRNYQVDTSLTHLAKGRPVVMVASCLGAKLAALRYFRESGPLRPNLCAGINSMTLVFLSYNLQRAYSPCLLLPPVPG